MRIVLSSHLEAFKLRWHFLETSLKLQMCFGVEKVLIGVIMITTYMKALGDFFKPNYVANIVSSWIPSLDGGRVDEKLKQGDAIVADVGCGHAISTMIMAKAYPKSKFVRFDYHEPSIEVARKRAKDEGLTEDRVTFEIASSTDFPSKDDGYDLVAFFDCLHDMGNPSGAAFHVLKTLKPDGTWMIVEPFAIDKGGRL